MPKTIVRAALALSLALCLTACDASTAPQADYSGQLADLESRVSVLEGEVTDLREQLEAASVPEENTGEAIDPNMLGGSWSCSLPDGTHFMQFDFMDGGVLRCVVGALEGGYEVYEGTWALRDGTVLDTALTYTGPGAEEKRNTLSLMGSNPGAGLLRMELVDGPNMGGELNASGDTVDFSQGAFVMLD